MLHLYTAVLRLCGCESVDYKKAVRKYLRTALYRHAVIHLMLSKIKGIKIEPSKTQFSYLANSNLQKLKIEHFGVAKQFVTLKP